MTTLLRGGTIITGAGQRRADLLLDGEKIAWVGRGPQAADREVDVSARSSGNVGVKIAHYHSLPHSLVIQAMRQGGQVCKSLSRSPLGFFDRLLPKFIKYGTNISS